MCGTPRVIHGVCFVLCFVCVLLDCVLFVRFISRVYAHTGHDNEEKRDAKIMK